MNFKYVKSQFKQQYGVNPLVINSKDVVVNVKNKTKCKLKPNGNIIVNNEELVIVPF
jgi:hypothetical protein